MSLCGTTMYCFFRCCLISTIGFLHSFYFFPFCFFNWLISGDIFEFTDSSSALLKLFMNLSIEFLSLIIVFFSSNVSVLVFVGYFFFFWMVSLPWISHFVCALTAKFSLVVCTVIELFRKIIVTILHLYISISLESVIWPDSFWSYYLCFGIIASREVSSSFSL